jgi:hypothetical protein
MHVIIVRHNPQQHEDMSYISKIVITIIFLLTLDGPLLRRTLCAPFQVGVLLDDERKEYADAAVWYRRSAAQGFLLAKARTLSRMSSIIGAKTDEYLQASCIFHHTWQTFCFVEYQHFFFYYFVSEKCKNTCPQPHAFFYAHC